MSELSYRSFYLKDAYNNDEKIWRHIIVNNEVLEKILQFLKQLRCEQISRKTSIRVPGLQEAEKEVEKLFEECSLYVDRLPAQEKQTIDEWVAKKEELVSLQEQNAYCQGYVDCVLLLSGLGLLQAEFSLDSFIEMLNL